MTVYVPHCGHCEACDIRDPNDFSALLMRKMYLCETCGNKRCPPRTPAITDCPCSGSNEPNQPGSSYQQRYFGDEEGTPGRQPSSAIPQIETPERDTSGA